MSLQAVLLTGMPGSGKTTLIKRIAEDMKREGILFSGFYTEEIRNVRRIGFDLLTFDGSREILARHNDVTAVKSPHRVGQYHVELKPLEQIVNSMQVEDLQNRLVVIDEVGSMELLSAVFKNFMSQLIENVDAGKTKLIATVPLQNKKNSIIIDRLKTLQNSRVFEVTKSNRGEQFYVPFREECFKMKT